MYLKNMIPLIARMTSDEYKRFCYWLREFCGITISELIEESPTYQKDAATRFYEETDI